MTLMTDEEAREHILARLRSRRWWVFVPAIPAANRLVAAVKGQFYSGQAAGDFEAHVVHTPWGIMFVFLGRKRAAPAKALAPVLGVSPEALHERDIIGDGAALRLLLAWLGGEGLGR